MALKNDPDLTPFAKRLVSLMGEDGPRDLAKKLLEANLVSVSFRGDINNPAHLENKDDNAIGAVEKKIQRHIKQGDPKEVQGEYIIAYSKFFNVSADYILMNTDIKTPDVETRRICDLTGLHESVVLRLIDSRKDTTSPVASMWSILMSSPLFDTLPEAIINTANQHMYELNIEAEIEASQWALTKVRGKDILSVREDLEGESERLQEKKAAVAGLIYKISRDVTNFIENYIIHVYAHKGYKEMYKEKMIEKEKKIYHIHE